MHAPILPGTTSRGCWTPAGLESLSWREEDGMAPERGGLCGFFALVEPSDEEERQL
ncbi:MAG: hypothetical protein ABR608_00340 [Pseudonocardiaceae bacterium]